MAFVAHLNSEEWLDKEDVTLFLILYNWGVIVLFLFNCTKNKNKSNLIIIFFCPEFIHHFWKTTSWHVTEQPNVTHRQPKPVHVQVKNTP